MDEAAQPYPQHQLLQRRSMGNHPLLPPKLGRTTDLYTKPGDSRAYGSILILAPDYGAGFGLLNALHDPDPLLRGEMTLKLIDQIAETVISSLEVIT